MTFQQLQVGLVSDIKRKTLPNIAQVVGLHSVTTWVYPLELRSFHGLCERSRVFAKGGRWVCFHPSLAVGTFRSDAIGTSAPLRRKSSNLRGFSGRGRRVCPQ